jgi:hypothetical protein
LLDGFGPGSSRDRVTLDHGRAELVVGYQSGGAITEVA